MNKNKKYIIVGLLSVFGLGMSSCESVLDKTDLAAASPALIAGDSILANVALSYIYEQNLPTWGGPTAISGLGTSIHSEESFYTGSSANNFIEGVITEADISDFGVALNATNNYGKIRTINSFIDDLNKDTKMLPAAKDRLLAQAYFFRAWRYFELVKLYGGVPLILTAENAITEEERAAAFVSRNTTTDCFKQIVSDIDKGIAALPNVWAKPAENWGRVTKGAAAAFKGRVLLYAASPQFNPTDNTAKWQAAYDANKVAFDILTASGAKLFADYGKMWFTEQGNTEAVFVTGFNNSTSDQGKKNNGWEASTRPAYATVAGGGSNRPSWNLVKAYPMKDGKAPGTSTKYPYTDGTFYANRDPRMNATIAYNGSTWNMSNVTNGRLWTYNVAAKTVENNGVSASITGFYCRKAIQTTDVAASTIEYSQTAFSGTDWMEIRFAEVLLNLAEAANGIGNSGVSYTQLSEVRKRAGIEAGTDNAYGLKTNMTKAEMFTAILNERQIEFAFEGKRFWDLRRWRLLESTLNNNKGAKVVINIKTTGTGILTAAQLAAARDGMTIDDVYKNLDVVVTPNSLMTRVTNYSPKYYFLPIPTAAINNNPNLKQNTGWINGTFDPLE
jgi:starch-binding outer membrane protein, SusD/RagB family